MFGKPGGDENAVRVKICGITNERDARWAIDCGANALGFNFFSGSKRFLDVRSAEQWLRRLPSEMLKVAVLVDPSWSEATRVADYEFIDCLQLHGNESPEFCQRLAERGVRFTKALPVSDRDSLLRAPQFFTNTILLDRSTERGFGGTGETFPWEIAAQFVKSRPELKVILAGGLTPENVAEAIMKVRPFGVDVTTGTELSPGQKDQGRLQAFIAAARSA